MEKITTMGIDLAKNVFSLPRVRQNFVEERTALINRLRAVLTESARAPGAPGRAHWGPMTANPKLRPRQARPHNA